MLVVFLGLMGAILVIITIGFFQQTPVYPILYNYEDDGTGQYTFGYYSGDCILEPRITIWCFGGKSWSFNLVRKKIEVDYGMRTISGEYNPIVRCKN